MMHEFNEDANFTEDMLFGDLIRKMRRLMGLNQDDFGQFVGGYSQKIISSWECKTSSPDYDAMRRILGTLGFELRIVKRESDVSHKATVNQLVSDYLACGMSKAV